MKKFIFFLSVCLGFLSSCSKDDNVDSEKNISKNRVITITEYEWRFGEKSTYGDVYEKNGFNLEKITSPNYTWSIHQNRYNRVNFMKHIISTDDNKDLTESEIMHNRGYFKVYDSGNVKYIKTYNLL